ncbi:NADH-quinone oxidoreductase subunit N [Solicola sp. PLA-1-18]|uniref:NADH-quinone oxidoreductase subunit N n=1 Tax=Solicola sp. PLA-1-18 TaxID=3380532 RepID=UPI003B814536
MIDWPDVLPALVVAGGGMLALLLDAFGTRRSWRRPGLVSFAALVVALGVVVSPARPDGLQQALCVLVLGGTLLVVLGAAVMEHEDSMPPGELHFLLLVSASGAVSMVLAQDLATLVVSLELLSLPSIALVGLRRGDVDAARGAWTFFVVSVVSTAVTLLGIAFVYGVSGTLVYDELALRLSASRAPEETVGAAVVLTVVGLLFKLGAVPLHLWVPATYRGASVPVAGYLSVVSKTGAAGALVLVLPEAFGLQGDAWRPVVAVAAALTLVVGNLGAWMQDDVVALLAWSSIAQAGFVLVPMAVLTTPGVSSAPVRYLAVYGLANLVAFGVVGLVRRRWGGTSFDHVTGLVRVEPWTGGALVLALLTLAGFPPAVVGLVAKYVVLEPLLDPRFGTPYAWLAVVAVVNVVVGLVYYLRLIVRVVGPVGTALAGSTVSPSPPRAVVVARLGVLLPAAVLVAASVHPDLLLSWIP